MRALLTVTIVSLGAVQISSGQDGRGNDLIYRGPVYASRPATPVAPANGMPLAFSPGTFALSPNLASRGRSATLETTITSRTVRTVPVSGILLRVAFGPMRYGMVTFRVRPDLGPDALPDAAARVTPNAAARSVTFATAFEDRAPGLLALTRDMQIVFTLQQLEDDEGHVIFENPDATELLWQALGRPSLSDR